jgi:hypothetical protein
MPLPTRCVAWRTFELRVYGPDHDLHSGQFGGTVHNPAQALMRIDRRDARPIRVRITLPGFYDKVRAVTGEERAEIGQATNR